MVLAPTDRRSRITRWGSVLGAVAAVVVPALMVLAPAARGAPATCDSVTSPPYVATRTATRLTPANDRTTKPPAINFGTSRAARDIAPYTFTVAGSAPDVTKMSWDFLLVDGNNTFPDSHASLKFSMALDKLRVALCLTPSGVPTGSYSGSLTLAGQGVKPVQIPLTINLKDNNVVLIWAGIVVAAIAAVFFKWWTMKVADANAPNGASLKEFWNWLTKQWVTVLLAVVGAAGGVYITKFANKDSFLASERWGLWVATFTAVMSASLLLNALGKAIEPPTAAKPKPAH